MVLVFITVRLGMRLESSVMVCDFVCGLLKPLPLLAYNHHTDQSHFGFLGSRCTSCTSIINCVQEKTETTSIEYGHIQYKLRLVLGDIAISVSQKFVVDNNIVVMRYIACACARTMCTGDCENGARQGDAVPEDCLLKKRNAKAAVWQ